MGLLLIAPSSFDTDSAATGQPGEPADAQPGGVDAGSLLDPMREARGNFTDGSGGHCNRGGVSDKKLAAGR